MKGYEYYRNCKAAVSRHFDEPSWGCGLKHLTLRGNAHFGTSSKTPRKSVRIAIRSDLAWAGTRANCARALAADRELDERNPFRCGWLP